MGTDEGQHSWRPTDEASNQMKRAGAEQHLKLDGGSIGIKLNQRALKAISRFGENHVGRDVD